MFKGSTENCVSTLRRFGQNSSEEVTTRRCAEWRERMGSKAKRSTDAESEREREKEKERERKPAHKKKTHTEKTIRIKSKKKNSWRLRWWYCLHGHLTCTRDVNRVLLFPSTRSVAVEVVQCEFTVIYLIPEWIPRVKCKETKRLCASVNRVSVANIDHFY